MEEYSPQDIQSKQDYAGYLSTSHCRNTQCSVSILFVQSKETVISVFKKVEFIIFNRIEYKTMGLLRTSSVTSSGPMFWLALLTS